MIKLRCKIKNKSSIGNTYDIKTTNRGNVIDIALESMFAGCVLIEKAKSIIVDEDGLTEKEFKQEIKNLCKQIEEGMRDGNRN